MLGLSLFLNIALAVTVCRVKRQRPGLRLKFGMLWDSDKNPHCPICKTGGLEYDEWTYRVGYLCKSCNKVFPLKALSGDDLTPAEALTRL